ncbi:hypothetical protein OWR29_46305 [Actinoplanes sp. Pm04-4]|jgi:hypothetical protein|uniref:Phosphatidate cytidylyltransferase n=1 Tax=Paractinoplanes pyxinae TaxID=2997416 RepID=A0ABT4BFZ0_9ACTN|nr:hypothetical protein [Actinoplanes pyxinae]MCY1145462.1 hypothetical protein [Actinoplanes pyxinae]
MTDPIVTARLAVLATAALIVLIGALGWPALLLGLAALAWYADARRR